MVKVMSTGRRARGGSVFAPQLLILRSKKEEVEVLFQDMKSRFVATRADGTTTAAGLGAAKQAALAQLW